jgi:decaprenylphospho-beta-D-erythro-pentofuranosid-2-ulose 2-reductase
MHNALGEAQNIVLLGGTSDIGLAIVQRSITPVTRRVVLAGRNVAECEIVAKALDRSGVVVEAVEFDAAETETHGRFVDDLAARIGDLDLVVLAFGVLGDQDVFDDDPAAAARAVNVNYAGGVSSGLAVARRFRRQGHGTLVVLSSVAGERVRKANFVYGSSKAGLDAFAQGLGDALEGSGAHVLIVRPGFVHSSMTAGRSPAPFATDPEAVAEAVARGLRSGRRLIWVPGVLRYVFMVLRHLPGWVFRRLPLG